MSTLEFRTPSTSLPGIRRFVLPTDLDFTPVPLPDGDVCTTLEQASDRTCRLAPRTGRIACECDAASTGSTCFMSPDFPSMKSSEMDSVLSYSKSAAFPASELRPAIIGRSRARHVGGHAREWFGRFSPNYEFGEFVRLSPCSRSSRRSRTRQSNPRP